MTEPGYIPPPVLGWWVKGNAVLFPTPVSLTLTAGTPRIAVGPTAVPAAAAMTLTVGTPQVTVGPTVAPAGVSLALTGGTPRLVTTVAPTGAALTLTAGTPFVGAEYSDGFNRADSTTSAGPNWVNRLNAMGVESNCAYAGTGGGVDCFATFSGGMITDDMRCTMTIGALGGSGNDYSMVLGANASGEGVRFTYLGGGSFKIYSMTSWTTQTQRDTNASAGITIGDIIVFERTGNVYNAYRNGALKCTWTDSTNIVPRDSSHRLVGIGAARGVNYARIDGWHAEDI